MKGRIAAALAVASLAGAGTAWAALTPEGTAYRTGTAPYMAMTADFNGDGRPDVATANGDGSTVSVFLRQAGGGFAEEAGSPFAAATSNGAVGDFNGDGRPDIATAGFVNDGVGVLIRNAGGGFTRETSPPVAGVLSAIGTGDFNADGRADLVVADWNAAGVAIFLRTTANTGFQAAGSYPTGANPRQIAVADFNGDGQLDVAVTNWGSGTVSILLGLGGGTFTPEGTPIATGTNPNGITAADFDGNGRADLAVSNSGSSTVSVLLRTDTGFAQGLGSPIAVAASPAQVASGDFDANGASDIAVAANSGVLDILLRAGAGFTHDTTPVSGRASGVAVADFDGDRRSDAAVSSYDINQLTAFLNPAPAPPSPTPTPTPVNTQLPAPDRGEVNVLPVSGTVKVKPKGSNRFVDLTQGIQIAVGATVDTRNGRVTIVGPGRDDKADFYSGLFKISQSRGLTTLTLTEPLTGCPKRGRASAVAAKKKSRELWGDGKGKFRTKGQYGAATIRGTRWLVSDGCGTTKVSVRQGSVNFRDEVKRRTVIVRKGRTYTARARRG